MSWYQSGREIVSRGRFFFAKAWMGGLQLTTGRGIYVQDHNEAGSMQRSIYLRPIGFIPNGGKASEEEVWGGMPLAGGPLAFTALEIIERNGARVERRMTGLSEFFERDWGRHTLPASDLFEALGTPRSRIGGLSMDRPRIMGIVNVTPDSFSDGGQHDTVQAAVDHALRLADEGADILDIGGESTRPGSDAVAVDDELKRVLPVLEALRDKTDKLISVDTRKAKVMRLAAEAGADILNDVSALTYDPDALRTAAETGLPVMLMHAIGDPKTMNDNPVYDDVVIDVFDFLERRIHACEAAGIPRSKLIVDPGIGFAKLLHHNVAVLSAMSLYHALGVPVLLGASRKKLIGQLCNVDVARERVPGSIAAALSSVAQGVQIVRVHDVAATRQAIAVWMAALFGDERALAEPIR
ncbi:dihydropteroate synthase [Filomicrobium insigne]|uniref:dihydropteroate synthase n=1 Tax=Filomicrobium insigne TaxID=418854 RepID=A0A1H0LMW5_9HYPH|nr:dihydropteroate synthase [Filomicrobium insigne]SDO69465.1 dihydropteroate synthase [Filomicrobium insigne]